ncbi:MAG: TonB-dependent receptor, partial [Candidatus Marinimicrobia bacterium]|nr:TonB-dependent receptor [Candidatus Neomarinimicrobiota bacterium]
MKKVLFGVLVGIFLSAQILASTISGKVQCHMEKRSIPDALVILLKPGDAEFSRTVVSGTTGNFFINNVEAGKYNIEVVKDGYYKNVFFDLMVESDKDYTVNIKLLRKAKKDDTDYCFMLGGIEVCSEQKELIPEDVVTTRKISSGEIEHMQATNLGDVLSLIPGVEKSRNPGLSSSNYVGIRAVATGAGNVDGLESFGTGIIVDGNELSNDAGLGSDGRIGRDLRTLPADNLESVEVLAGIASAEYSNLSSGAVSVKTKTGVMAPKIKFKFNPDTKEASFIHGFNVFRNVFDYSANWARSERDLRLENDAVDRYYLKTNISRKAFDDRLQARLSTDYTQLIVNQEPEDEKKIRSFSRDYYLNNSFDLDFDKSNKIKYHSHFNVNLARKQNHNEIWKSDMVIYDRDSTFTVIVDGVEAQIDSMIADTAYGYVGEKDEIGKEWNISGILQRRQVIKTINSQHSILTGVNYRYDFNRGDGVIVDSVFNYYGASSTKRSYTFDEFPDLKTLSIYIEDNIEGTFKS